MRKIEKIVVHWLGNGQPTWDMQTVRDMHIRGRGFRDIGYHRGVLHPAAQPGAEIPSDLIKQGRTLDSDLFISDAEVGAHTLGMNRNSVGVLVFHGENFKSPMPELQKSALKLTLDILVERFELSPQDVIGHRDVNATLCPGDEIYEFITQYREGNLPHATILQTTAWVVDCCNPDCKGHAVRNR